VEAFLLGLLALSDAVLLHTFSPRAALIIVALGYGLVRMRAWVRSRATPL
jgi:hypothetical protein